MTLDFKALHALYQDELINRCVPFWVNKAIDWENGGLCSCIADDGKIINNDKYMWSQLRALWTFSALYLRVERRPEWLNIANHLFQFIKKYGRDKDGKWVYLVDAKGKIKEGAISIYADGFALYGLTEYYRATNNQTALELAQSTYLSILDQLRHPGSYLTAPYDLPKGIKAHGIPMIFAHTFEEYGLAIKNAAVLKEARALAQEIMDHFVHPQDKFVYEFIKEDNTLWDDPQGRALVPGHGIECMWFLIHLFRTRGEKDQIKRAIRIIRNNLELGWDQQFGGIYLGMDNQGKTPVWWKFHDTKLWWPQAETLYALLLAYEHTGENWCIEWYQKVHKYAWSHYPVKEHGEWTQKLNRDGTIRTAPIALPVKDPFHLPRAFIYCIEVLGRLSKK